MRVIAGTARGITLKTPEGMQTRPTADRVKEALFSIIHFDLPGARVLDLFGGTGALALEALSRGAASAVIVDSARAAVQVIGRNAANVLGEAWDARLRVLRSDYRSAISRLEGPFGLVFLDPPYRMAEAYQDALARLLEAGLLSEGCLAVLERAAEADIGPCEGFEVFDTRRYGDTAVDFVRLRRTAPRQDTIQAEGDAAPQGKEGI